MLRPRRLSTLCHAVASACLGLTAALGGEPTINVPSATRYGLDFWREADGLPQSRVRQIVQTRDGYLWLGTVGGLIRFDGARFTAFDVQTGALRDNEVWAIREDRDGALWIGTVGGGLTRFANGEFTTITKADGLPDDVIRHVDFDREGNLWISTLRGVCRRENGTFRTFTQRDGLRHESVTRFSASSSEGVFAVAGERLHRFDGERFVLADDVLTPEDGRPLILSSVRDGSLWISCEGGVAKQIHRGAVKTFACENHLTARNAVIFQDSHGTIWMGARDGLRRLEGDTFRIFSPRGNPVPLGPIMTIAEDREGSLWFGLETNGLARLRRAQFLTLGEEDGLTETSLRSVYQDRHGDIWLGTASGFARYRNGTVTNITTFNGSPLSWGNTFAEGPDATLWVGSAAKLFHLRNDELTPVPGWNPSTDIKAILRDPQNRMWVTTDGDGVFIFEGNNVRRLRAADGLAGDHARGILCDRQGVYWIATFGSGLSRYENGTFTNFTTRDGLGSDRVVAIHEFSDGSLWFSTRGGVTRYRDGKFRNFTAADGLPVNFVSSILDDDRGNLWFSSDLGIFQVRASDFEDVAAGRSKRVNPIAYGVKDGMSSAGFIAGQQPSACRTRDGRMLFPSLRGLVVVDPARIFSNTIAPPVHIESARINGQARSLRQAAEIGPGDNRIEIHYTALSLMAPEKVRFRYQLVGIDPDWIDAGTRRFAYFANLPAGDYTFRVSACNNDGVWNESGAQFAFRLKPYFYETRWFYALCAFGLIVVPAALYRLRVRRLEARQAELKQKVAEAVAKVRVLSGMLPICASCKKVRDDRGYWNQIEVYIRDHSDTQISHGICPDCVQRLYPEVASEVLRKSRERSKQTDPNNPELDLR